MPTLKTLENIKKGSRITIFNGIYAILLAVFYFIFFNFILKTNLKAMDIVWQVFSKYNPQINSLILRLMILKGIFILAIGILIIYLSVYIFKKKDKASWIILFIVGLIFWPSLLTFELLDKNWYTAGASFFGWLTFVIGMLIPIKYYTQVEYDEY